MWSVVLVAALAIANPQPASVEDASETVGKNLAGAQDVKVDELVSHPDNYLGKAVRVRGVVVDVGGKGTTWLDVADDPGGPKVRIEVDDAVTGFSSQARGNPVVAEGIFTKAKRSTEAAKADTKESVGATTLSLEGALSADSIRYSYQIRASASGIKM